MAWGESPAPRAVPDKGTRRDRVTRELTADWLSTRELSQRAGLLLEGSACSAELHVEEVNQRAERRDAEPGPPSGGYEWRRGERWVEVYG